MESESESWMSGHIPLAVLTLLCLILFLPGLTSLPPTDRDEARFLQASKQMLETGDLMTIRFQDDLRNKKPVGIHWLQVTAVKLFAGGDRFAVWAYRLPSALSAWLTVLVTFVIGRRLFGASSGLLAAGLLACTLLFVVEAHIAKTDAALALAVTLAHLALLTFYISPSDNRPPFSSVLLFWAAIGLGLLIKGPIIIAIVGATTLALCAADRSIKWLQDLQPTIGIPIAFGFLIPWLAWLVATGNGDVVVNSLTEDLFPKLFSGQESHGALPGSYLLASPVLLWPASLVMFPGLLVAAQYRHEQAVRFSLAWGCAAWLMFELIPTKLPHYVLPTLPGLVLAAAAGVLKSRDVIPRWSCIMWGLVSALLAGALVWATLAYGGSLLVAGLLAVMLIATTALTWTPQKNLEILVPSLAIILFGLTFSILLPSLSKLSLSARLAEIIEEEGGGPVALSRFHEPSAVFLLGTETWLTNTRNVVAHIAADPDALGVVALDELEHARDMLVATQENLEIVDQVDGYNYAKGRPEQMVIIRRARDQPIP